MARRSIDTLAHLIYTKDMAGGLLHAVATDLHNLYSALWVQEISRLPAVYVVEGGHCLRTTTRCIRGVQAYWMCFVARSSVSRSAWSVGYARRDGCL